MIGKTETRKFFERLRDLRKRWSMRLDELFPERQLVVRTGARVSYFCIPKAPQIALTLVLIGASGWVGFSSVSYLLNDRILSAKNGQIMNARMAYQSLLNEVSAYQNKFIAITRDLEANHSRMLGMGEKNAALQQNLSTVENELRMAEAERRSVIDTRERLKNNLDEIQDDLHALTSRNYLLRGNLDTVESDLQTVVAERNAALVKSKRMTTYIGELENRLVDLQSTQIDTVAELMRRTDANIESVERVVSIAGIDIPKLIDAAVGSNTGQGGPFIAAPGVLPGEDLKSRLTALDQRLAHLESLQQAMQHVPLAAPLTAYYMTSKFGKRRDPVNEKWSMHYGVDLGSSNKSPIYAPAPGVVTFAGWKGNYGKLIEISHGGGIKTRYGHLSKILVKKGQEVGFYGKVGLVGSTGRSTGPHLHYEVVFNKKPMDPMNFIKAGRYVFQE